jgi:hypothetical protein
LEPAMTVLAEQRRRRNNPLAKAGVESEEDSSPTDYPLTTRSRQGLLERGFLEGVQQDFHTLWPIANSVGVGIARSDYRWHIQNEFSRPFNLRPRRPVRVGRAIRAVIKWRPQRPASASFHG